MDPLFVAPAILQSIQPVALPEQVLAIDVQRESLLSQLAHLDRERELALARTAPIRRLVDDMLRYIFELGAADDVFFPETVSSVSRHWRELVMRTPAAWSNLILDRRIFPHSVLPAFMRRSEVFLARSQSAPLTLKLDLLPMPFDQDVAQLMEILHPHLHRCSILHLNVDANWLSVIANALSTLGPSLQELDIRTSHANTVPVSLTFTEIDGTIPQLQHLVLSNLPPSSLPATQFPALISLELWGLQWPFPGNDGAHEWPWSATANLLESTPNLKSLLLCRMELALDSLELLSPRKITLERLETLAFECMETRSVAIVFEALVAPNLKSLRMKYDPSRQGDHWCMHRLDASCLEGLQELEVDGYSIHGANLSWFLRTLKLTTRLEHLTISNPPLLLDPRFFEHMSTGVGVGGWLVPRLKELTLISCASLLGSDLVRFTRARSNANFVSSSEGTASSLLPSTSSSSLAAQRNSVSPIGTLTLKMPPWSVLDEESLTSIKNNVETLNHSTTDTYSPNGSLLPATTTLGGGTGGGFFTLTAAGAVAGGAGGLGGGLGGGIGGGGGGGVGGLGGLGGGLRFGGQPMPPPTPPVFRGLVPGMGGGIPIFGQPAVIPPVLQAGPVTPNPIVLTPPPPPPPATQVQQPFTTQLQQTQLSTWPDSPDPVDGQDSHSGSSSHHHHHRQRSNERLSRFSRFRRSLDFFTVPVGAISRRFSGARVYTPERGEREQEDIEPRGLLQEQEDEEELGSASVVEVPVSIEALNEIEDIEDITAEESTTVITTRRRRSNSKSDGASPETIALTMVSTAILTSLLWYRISNVRS